LKDSGQKQLSKVDPDARSVVLHRNIINVGYNVQAGSDSKHKLFTNAQTGSVNDTPQKKSPPIVGPNHIAVRKMACLTCKSLDIMSKVIPTLALHNKH